MKGAIKLLSTIALTATLAACGREDLQGADLGTESSPAKADAGTPNETWRDTQAGPDEREGTADGTEFELTSAPDASCPTGFSFNATYRLCESSERAHGPFSQGMVDACKTAGGGAACGERTWARDLARRIRGTGQCPKGTWLDLSRAECTDGTSVFGPFSKTLVAKCKTAGGGSVCETMRWHKSFVPEQAAASGGWNARVLNYYTVWANYDRVTRDVLRWYGTRTNGCVAFMSTALRHVGFDIPKNKMIDGYYVSLWTTAFARHLANKGWSRIGNYGDLRPGDVVFTVGEQGDPTQNPLHTYMFQSWKDRVNKIGWVIDNQGFTHERDIFSYGSANFSPFAYAMRSRD